MQFHIRHLEWRALRQVARTRKPSPGHTLRMDMSRRTKGGGFLADLVAIGLLAVAEAGPDPLAATYTLTDLGREAAEYGVYEMPWEEYRARAKAARPAAKAPGKPGRKKATAGA